ncbi:choline/ethanolamine transporter flvcr2a [Leptinotarsa decemlineata]|uniref:choline/ethanolamine transporter flvcr2a n=1 Tax=Leptinotarsa decemlineata TaxID=7539 RepID=UPI003D307CC6
MISPENKDLLEKCTKTEIKVYRRRWLILAIYNMFCAANSFQWLEYSIITNIVMKFYNVDSLDVDWTSIIYMAIYPIIVIPVSYIIDKKGLRVAALIGGLGTALAAAVKVFSIRRDLFYVVLIGQAIGSTAQVFVICLPTKIAAVWFKDSEASTACALGVLGTQVGFALGFLIPPTLVKNSGDVISIGSDLRTLCQGLAIYMIPVSIAIVFFFPRQPALPPSVAQMHARKIKSKTFKEFLSSFKAMITQNAYICHLIAFGINIGVFASVGTLLNQFVLQYFPNAEEDAGRMAFISVCCGIAGALLNGVYLDKTRKFRDTTLFNYVLTTVSAVLFMVTLQWKKKVLVYLTYAMFGFFSNCYMSVGFEMAVEITYPLDESTSAGLLNASTQAFGVVIVLLLGKLNEKFGALWSIFSQVILLLIGTYLTYRIPNVKKRQEAFSRGETGMNSIQTS